jgi:hypothetical protein
MQNGMPDARPTPTRSGRMLVLIAAVVLAVTGIGAVIAFVSQGSSSDFPDSVLGYERLRGGVAERVERSMESIRIGEIEILAALYGERDEPRLLAAIYEHYPDGVEIEAIIQGAAGGAAASGGTVDQGSLQISDSNGVRFACMSGGGPGFLVPGGPSEEGVLCAFTGDRVGLMVTTHTTEPVLGLMDVRTFVEAYEAA